ncbi:MAG: efflux transporter outer membrane subunit [Bacteroidales bacterium]
MSLFSSSLYAKNPIRKYLENPMPGSWTNDSLFSQQLPIEDNWWEGFEDQTLDSLMQTAMQNNSNVLIAAQRIITAKAQMKSAYGGLFPNIGLNAGWNRQRVSHATEPVQDVFSSGYSAGLSMSWELDVFGNIWQKARAEGSLYKASKAEYYGVMVSLASNLATSYFNLRTYQELLKVTQSNIKSQAEVLEITEVRYNTGLASQLDVAQAKSIYYSTKSALNPIQASIDNTVNSIAVLLGVYPEEIRAQLMNQKSLPSAYQLIPVSIPAGLLTQRPDLISSLKQVQAQAALLGASRADWFPKFLLNGSIGFSAPKLDHLFEKNSQTWQIAPAMQWTIFNGGQRREAYISQRAALDEAIITFNQNVLTAYQEVENAMSNYKNSVKEMNDLVSVVNQGKITLDLSIELYKEGLSQFQDVLSAQQSLLSYEESLVKARGGSLLYLVQLYQSLGGGWDETQLK